MINPNREKLSEAYEVIKSKAGEYVQDGQYEKALRQLEYAASIAWSYPILSEFIDDELESMIGKVAGALLPCLEYEESDSAPERGGEKRVVFYNGQIVDAGALTEQYLNYLLDQGYRILFIVPDIRNTVAGQLILERLGTDDRVEVFVPEPRSRVRKIRQIYDAIDKFNPGCSFLHFLPNDVVGYASFVKFRNHIRYYIVHNDHTFWLGKGCSDYFFEFRQLGVRISTDKRGIAEAKIICLPYYPIDRGVEFLGFPANFSKKVIGLSGATLYKYFLDPKLRYFHEIKDLLEKYRDFVFCLCGKGSADQVEWIQSFIKEYRLEERFYYLGDRSDFYRLVGHIDIMFDSYPLGGGLTILCAINRGKAITGLGTEGSFPGKIEECFDLVGYRQPITFEEFRIEASELISNKEHRLKNAQISSRALARRKDFDAKLGKVIMAGNSFVDPLDFHLRLECPEDSDFDMYFQGDKEIGEILNRAWMRSFIDNPAIRRLQDLMISLRYNGLSSVISRVRKALSKKFSL